MPNFSYRALGKDGREVRGALYAESEMAAISRIRENYLVLLKISKQSEKKSITNILEMEIGNKQIGAKTLCVLCSQFAIILRSGMPIARAMRMLAGQCLDKRLKAVLESAAKDVAAGSTVAAALERHQERFPLTFIEMIRAGEQSGTLESSFERLHQFYEKSYKTTEKIKSALTYPIFVIQVAVVVLVVVMAKIIPTLAGVFLELNSELPFMTRLLIGISDFFAQQWLVLIAVFAAVCLVYQIYIRTPNGKLVRARLLLSLPFLGTISQMNVSAQFTHTLAVLLGAGITLDQAIGIAAKVIDNALFQENVRAVKAGIERGRSLSDCLNSKTCFPQIMIDMCSVGEETGELKEMLEHAADYYTNEADYQMQRILTLLEPMLLIGLSLFTGFIVISIYLPIFTMYDLM